MLIYHLGDQSIAGGRQAPPEYQGSEPSAGAESENANRVFLLGATDDALQHPGGSGFALPVGEVGFVFKHVDASRAVALSRFEQQRRWAEAFDGVDPGVWVRRRNRRIAEGVQFEAEVPLVAGFCDEFGGCLLYTSRCV